MSLGLPDEAVYLVHLVHSSFRPAFFLNHRIDLFVERFQIFWISKEAVKNWRGSLWAGNNQECVIDRDGKLAKDVAFLSGWLDDHSLSQVFCNYTFVCISYVYARRDLPTTRRACILPQLHEKTENSWYVPIHQCYSLLYASPISKVLRHATWKESATTAVQPHRVVG